MDLLAKCAPPAGRERHFPCSSAPRARALRAAAAAAPKPLAQEHGPRLWA